MTNIPADILDGDDGITTETDPVYSAWNKSAGISITETQVSDLTHFSSADETDPTVPASVKDGTDWTEVTNIPADILDGDDGITTEADPVYSAWNKSTGISITETQVSDLTHFVSADETDPTVPASVKDGTDWTEVTNIPADIIDGDDGIKTEADPVYSTWDKSTGISITETQVSDLTHFASADETDPTVNLSKLKSLVTDDFHKLGGDDQVDDADADPENEWNTGLALSGTTLKITDAGATLTADLGGLSDDLGDHTATKNISLMSFWLSGDGGDEGISIDSVGNVGIGTLASAKLDVRVDSLSAGANTMLWSPSGTADADTSYVHFGTTGDWYIRPGTTDGKVIIADNGGNVGIGTTKLIEKLTVAGNIVPSASDTYTLGTADNVWKDVYVGNNSLHIGGLRLSNTDGALSWGNQPISAWSPVTGGINYSSGNVGIGTSTSGSKLQVVKTIGSNDMGAYQHETQMAIFGPGTKSMALGVMDNGKGMIQVKESGVGYNSLCLNPVAGNVGIGTTASSAKLDVRVNSLSDGSNTMLWSSSGTVDTDTSYVHFGTTGDWYIRPGTTDGKVIIADNGGNVGIGTTKPRARLDVVGPGAPLFSGDVNRHVATFQNTVSGGDGIAIKLADNAVTDDNNFVTFYGGDNRIAGRIEGYEHKADVVLTFLQDLTSALGGLFSDPLSLIDLDTGITYNSDWFDAGKFPEPKISGGSFPTICGLSLCGGELPTVTIEAGKNPSFSEPFTFNTPSLSINTDVLEQKFIDFMSTVYAKGLDPLLEFGFYDSFDPVQLAVLPARIQVQSIANDNGVTYGSKGADYAEWLPKQDSEEVLPQGSVVGVFAGKISLETEGADQIMAISSTPIVLGNIPPEGKEAGYAKTGFLGQIPVFVRGRTNLGDFIVPSGREDGTGVAVRPDDITLAEMSKVLGRAWSASERRGVGLIRVSVGLDRNSWAMPVEVLHKQITKLGEDNAELMTQRDLILSENLQLKARLATAENRQKDIENMLLALSIDLPKEKIVQRLQDKRLSKAILNGGVR